MVKIGVFISVVVLVLGGYFFKGQKMNKNNKYTYVITETKKYESLDPLSGDLAINLPVQRMLYLTPLEISMGDKLTSHILDSFTYDKSLKLITWNVKEGVTYSDGKVVTAQDVAFAVARMMVKRPKFPVLEDVEGAAAWLGSEVPLNSLPTGIKVEGQKITIALTKPYKNPLFRFCLELFSIIPKSCVDLATNKINCDKIPTSGYYELVSEDKFTVNFRLREDFNKLLTSAPRKVDFKYAEPKVLMDDLSEFDNNTIVAGSQFNFMAEKLSKYKNSFSVKNKPASRFLVLLLNPKNEVFKNKKCRRVFADAFRSSYAEVNSSEKTGSVFTKIIRGYLSYNELDKSAEDLTDSDRQACVGSFEANPPKWGYVKSSKNEKFSKVLEETYNKLGIKDVSSVEVEKGSEYVDKYLGNTFSISTGGSGFWALDPAGDVKMLFTPNMHKMLSQVANNDQLQGLIDKISDINLGGEEEFKALNQYLFDQAIFNIYAHVNRFYISKNKDLINEIPIGIASPAPWQLFNLD